MQEEKEYYCNICGDKINKWQHEKNNDICTFCQDDIDEDPNIEMEE